jgi:hypothetical protein
VVKIKKDASFGFVLFYCLFNSDSIRLSPKITMVRKIPFARRSERVAGGLKSAAGYVESVVGYVP